MATTGKYINRNGQEVVSGPNGVLTEKEAALLYLYEGAHRLHPVPQDVIEWQARVRQFLNGWKP